MTTGNFPRCNCASGAVLQGVELAPGLPALQCPACDGSVLKLDDYRSWQPAPAAVTQPPHVPEIEDRPSARSCPACGRLMQRHRVGSSPDFRVDHCAPCQLVWLDRGEWPALTQAGLAGRLAEILTERWQRRLQNDEIRQQREAALRGKHGDACLDELARIRTWLAEQPHRDELIALLRTGW
ncbi:MAG: zf-TFIIB domain-containing protein [Uliginosibacterium sp.]|nr:zf-TFIIB domain-containing protein [Uliginosibacterium sp.]